MAFEGLSEKLNAVFKRLRGKGRLTEADVLETMREVYAARVEERFPLPVQLDYGERTADAGSDGEFII